MIELSLAVLASTGIVGLVLSMLGIFRPLVATVGGVSLGLLFLRLWSRAVRRPDSVSSAWFWVALLAVVVIAALNLPYASEEIWTGRDGGTYTQTAIRIAETGSILVPAGGDQSLLPDDASFSAPGFALSPSGRIVPQFLHVFPVLGAIAYGFLGFPGLFGFNVVIGALALLVLFLVAERRVGGLFALMVMLGVGLSLPFTYFSRGRYSEITFMVFLYGAVFAWDRVSHESQTPGGALAVGVLCGAAVLTRIDGWLLLLPIGALMAWGDDVIVGIHRQWFMRGFGSLSLLAVIDLAFFSPHYLSLQSPLLIAIVVGCVVTATSSRLLWVVRPRLFSAVRSHPSRLALALGLVLVGFIVILSVRASCCPSYSGVPNSWVAAAQENESAPIEADRTYSESSPLWLGWYIGWPAVIIGAFGSCLLAVDFIRRRAELWIPIVALSLPFLVYLVRPSITPDHIWAARRMLPVLLPFVLLISAFALKKISGFLRRWMVHAVAVPVLLSGSLMAVPVFSVQEWAGSLRFSDVICQSIDGRPVLIVDGERGLARQQLLIPLASICGVPAGFYALDDALSGFSRDGLVVVTQQVEVIEQLGFDEVLRLEEKVPVLERTVTRVPARSENVELTVLLGTSG